MNYVQRFLLSAVLFTSVSSAGQLTLILDQPSQATLPGAFLSFSGTISNGTAGEVFLNGAFISPAYFELTDDLWPFFASAPLSLQPGDAYSGELFTVAVSGAASLGTYPRSFSIQGGVDSGALNDIAGASFQIKVVPEPLPLVVVSLGLLALVLSGRSLRDMR